MKNKKVFLVIMMFYANQCMYEIEFDANFNVLRVSGIESNFAAISSIVTDFL
jgi:hypothetical protein